MSSTDVLQRLVETTTDEPPELFHYVKKAAMTESAITGAFVRALCGEIFPVTKVPKKGSPVCQPCQEIFDQMKKD